MFDNLILSLNTVTPVLILTLLGMFMKKIKLLPDSFYSSADKYAQPFQLKLQSVSYLFSIHYYLLLKKSGGPGLAFLRESHGGYNSPPDCCQEPPFESILALSPLVLDRPGLDSCFALLRSGGPKWTRTIDLTIISRVL